MQNINKSKPAFDSTLLGTILNLIQNSNPALTSGVPGLTSGINVASAPRDVLAGPIGAASTLLGGQVSNPNSPQQVQDAPQLDPITDAVQKQVIKNTKAHVDQAMASGVPAEHILQTQAQKAPALSRLFGGLINSGSVNKQTGDVVQPSALWGLIQSTPEDQLNRQNAANARPSAQLNQKIQEANLVPPTQAQKLASDTSYGVARMKNEADSLKRQQELYKPLPPEQGAKFSALLEGRDASKAISDMLLNGDDPNGYIVGNQFTPDFFKGDGLRQYNTALEIAIQQKTRAETGATLGKGELANTIKRYQPRVGDSVKTISSRLKPLFGYFDRAIQIVDPSGVHQERANQTENKSKLLQALIAEKQRRVGGK